MDMANLSPADQLVEIERERRVWRDELNSIPVEIEKREHEIQQFKKRASELQDHLERKKMYAVQVPSTSGQDETDVERREIESGEIRRNVEGHSRKSTAADNTGEADPEVTKGKANRRSGA